MAKQFSELPRSGQLYVGAVIILGAVVISHSSAALMRDPLGGEWVVLAALTLLTGSFSIKVPSVNARISVSEAFVIAAVLSFGLHVATVIVTLDSLILSSWLRKSNRLPLRIMFNMAAGALAISSAVRVLEWLLPVHPAASAPLDQLLVPVLLLAVSYFLINSWLIAIAVAYEQQSSASQIWRRNFLWFGLNYLGGASVAIVLVNFARNLNLAAVSAVIPLVIILYITFRTSWGRVEDANRHVAQVNELYLSTIETLAMAVDAKDQITHGHIRRVQVFALELSKRLGVSDEHQLKAIATAALLHDMGKLAIPEHILNKPGRLTAAEFEKMKRHADIGADLLSSVKFPYPVVPIVRHHHEHWNGSGYPAGISGTDIPLGARILSVVDCFDALTSDRPYRPRLSSEEAFTIIRERRATTYDPLVVDTFIRAYPEIAPLAIRAGQEAHSVINMAELAPPTDVKPLAPLQQIRANASEAAFLDAYARDIAHAVSPQGALQVAAQCLRQLTPSTVCALFLYDSAADVLTCACTAGDEHRLIDGLSIKLGEKITGWVAANRRTSLNSDASLDLAQIAGLFTPPLRSAMSTPLAEKECLIGVLTAYCLKPEAFNENHRYTFEQIASGLARRFSSVQLNASSSNVVSFRMLKS
jgi:putative nucleotidyltransferase with HDIG domain